jgi:hypothetical protein
MASLAQINVKFSTDLRQYSSQLQTALRETEKVGKEMQKVGAAMSIAITAPFVALAGVSLVNFDTQAKAIAQVEAGLKSTGATAGFTSEQLQRMASELQDTSLFGDEVILKDATAQLLTFTNIAGEQFARTQKAALDLATRLDGDLKGASIQLGKALNDPIANLSALSRSGIQFSESQKKTIAQMVKMNRLADAQTLILDELEKQYGGSATAAAKAGTGPLKQLSNSWGDLTEQFGKIISEAINPLAMRLKGLVEGLQKLSPETKKTIVVVGGLLAVMGPVVAIIGTILTLIPSMVAGFVAVKTAFAALTASIAANPLGAIAVALGLVVGALYAYSQANKEVVKTKTTLEKIEATASDNLAKERVNLERLVKIAKDESKSKTERLKAIKDLNKLSPEYLGNLTLESINTDKATTAVENYTAALLKKFRVEAAENELKELANKRFQLELGQLKAKEALLKQEQKINSNSTDLERKAFENRKRLTEEGGQLIQKYYNEEQRLLEGIVNGTEAVNQSVLQGNEGLKERAKLTAIKPIKAPEQTGTISNFEAEIAKLRQFQDEVSTTAATWQAAQKKIEQLELKITIAKDGYASLIDSDAALNELAANYEAAQKRIAAANEAIRSQAVMVAGAVGDAFTTLGENYVASLDLAENGIQGFAKVMIQTVTKLLAMALSNAIANSIVNATQSATATGPAAVFTQPAFIATAVGGVLAAFAAIPKFNDGGIVGGTSTYGDKILARVNSGELILNQRQQKALDGMLSSQDGAAAIVNVNVEGVITGDQIRIVSSRNETITNRKR